MRVLCFGDSNTYGYDPRSFLECRYPPGCRWVDILSNMLGCTVINCGENGRVIPKHEWDLRHFNVMLSEYDSIDLLVIMLGINDLLQGDPVESVVDHMTSFLIGIPLENSQIILIGPPGLKPGSWITDDRLLKDCARLSTSYSSVAERLGIRFIDAFAWDIEMTFDGVHFSAEGHQAFADSLFRILRTIR